MADLLLLIGLRAYSVVGVLVAAGLLLLSVLQFWHALHIGFSDLKRSVFAPISHETAALSPDQPSKTGSSVKTNELAIPNGPPPAETKTKVEETEDARRGANETKENTETRKKEYAKQALVFAIHGLEFVLLAPICFVVTRSLFAFILVKYGRVDGLSKELAEKPELQNAGTSLIASKALLIGLLSSLVGVDIVSRVLESKETINPSMWIKIAVLAVLGAYYIGLERLAAATGEHPGPNGAPKPTPENRTEPDVP